LQVVQLRKACATQRQHMRWHGFVVERRASELGDEAA